MAYSITASNDSCYPDTTILINKLGIKDQHSLDEAERIAVTYHAARLEADPPDGPFTFHYYRMLHQQLFSDLYDWAGTLRSIDLSKKGTHFYPAKDLQPLGSAIFQRLQSENELRNLPFYPFVTALSEFYHDLNMLHPFREGNGRTQRLFTTLLVRRAGYNIDFADCDTDLLMTATIYAAQGIMDHLHAFFESNISLLHSDSQPF